MKVITDKKASDYRLVKADYHRGFLWATFRREDGTTFDLTFRNTELAQMLRTGFGMAAEMHNLRGEVGGVDICREVMRIADIIDADG
jgi:hypothetical protein